MDNVPDNYDLFVQHEKESNQAEHKICDICKQEIVADSYYRIESQNICDDCIEEFIEIFLAEHKAFL